MDLHRTERRKLPRSEAFWIASGNDQECRRRVGSYAEHADQARCCRPGESFELALQVADLLAELMVATGERTESILGHSDRIVQTAGTEALAARYEGSGRETSSVSRSSAGAVTTMAFT